MKKPIFLCDVDGTIALTDGRGPYEWRRVGEDKPNAPVVTVVSSLAEEHTFGFVTGRIEQCREETLDWLDLYVRYTPSDMLWMRPDDDYRPDEQVKREIYERDIKPHYEVIAVFDDRSKVVAMWRELGLTCFAVAAGNF